MAELSEPKVQFRNEQLPPELNKIIGKGLDFKRIYSKSTNKFSTNTGIDRINQSIYDILSTRVGERGFMREYGSNLYKLLFSLIDEVFYDMVRIYAEEAVRKWEKRIYLQDVEIETNPELIDNNTVYIRLNYILRNSNVSGSYVYPFVTQPMPLGSGRELNDQPFI